MRKKSNHGVPLKYFFDQLSRNSNQCFSWPYAKSSGYGVVRYEGKLWKAHRLSLMLSFGMDPKKKHGLHKCNNPQCFNPNHLYWGTAKENMKDKIDCGRSRNNRKLSDSQILEIFNSKEPQKITAKKFCVDQALISKIKNGKVWPDITSFQEKERSLH